MNLRRGKVGVHYHNMRSPNLILAHYTCVVVVHSSLSQMLIRHEWEASLPDVGLNKPLRTKAQRHFQRGQYLIGGRVESPPTAGLMGKGLAISNTLCPTKVFAHKALDMSYQQVEHSFNSITLCCPSPKGWSFGA